MELRKEGAGPPLRAGAVLLAAGRSSRMGGDISKALIDVRGVSVVRRSADAIAGADSVRRIVVVGRDDDESQLLSALRGIGLESVTFARGGEERTDSVRAGIESMEDDVDVILVHDAARCFVRSEDVERVARAAFEHGAALLAARVRDTLKISPNGVQSAETVDRDKLWAAQTPQGMRTARFRDVVARAKHDAFRPTDDAALHEHYHGPTRLVESSGQNPKLTTPGDLAFAEAFARVLETGARR